MPGVLTQTDFAHTDRAFNGGPVGELTQWADLIATLYLLGHDLELRWDIQFVGIEYAIFIYTLFLIRLMYFICVVANSRAVIDKYQTYKYYHQ